MMRLWGLLAICLLPGPALAQTARVTAGDHDGFSRLVVELPVAADWRFGRQSDGYALVVDDATVSYDLVGIFDLIGRQRLAAVAVSPVNGNLEIGLACACHAIPFEFRPGVIVIDIREGAPPAGSSFEATLDPVTNLLAPRRPKPRPDTTLQAQRETPAGDAILPLTAPALRVAADPAPAPLPSSRWVLSPLPAPGHPSDQIVPSAMAPATYDWREHRPKPDSLRSPGLAIPLALSQSGEPLADMRDDLLVQISRGAARGVVVLAGPRMEKAATEDAPMTAPVISHMAVDPLPGMSAATTGDAEADLTASGADCIDDAALDLGSWGRPGPAAAELWSVSSGLVGEFDAVDADALRAAVRYNLHLGFGAEAAHLAKALAHPDLAAESVLWTSLGKLLDGRTDPDGPFVTMASCDSAAALWAVLSPATPDRMHKINSDAVLRSFSALPLSLRLSLGPELADRFLRLGREDVVRGIWGGITRSPQGSGATADLIDASMEMDAGSPAQAAELAQGVIAGAGPDVAKAMLALVDASLAQGKSIDGPTIDALHALLRENEGAALEQPLARALILSLASNGDADAAFALLDDHPGPAAELWTVLADLGADSDLLTWAVGSPGDAPGQVTASTRLRVAERLMSLGFASSALAWLGPKSDGWDQAETLLAAEAQLAQNDPAAALTDLAALDDPLADALSARAQLQSGDARAAAQLYQKVADTSASDHAMILAQDWSELASTGPALWNDAANLVNPPVATGAPQPPLAEAAALLADAVKVRETLTLLLAAVNSPAPSSAP